MEGPREGEGREGGMEGPREGGSEGGMKRWEEGGIKGVIGKGMERRIIH